ncbi:MAG: dTDP-4-dehydrorhamnose reductase [Verrucomicrobiota bacterium]
MKILLLGANGQLGSDLVKVFKTDAPCHVLSSLTHAELEITAHDRVRAVLQDLRPDVVINTAAYHKVDEVEQNPDRAFAVNATAVWNLAKACREINATLAHISTDYVFGQDLARQTPYTENEKPAPLNVYGVSKAAGELLLQSVCPRHYIVRTSGLYGVKGASAKGGNFVETMLRLAKGGKAIKVVDDQRLTPTFTVDLAKALIALIASERYGLYHATNSGDCTWFEFAQRIFQLAGLSPSLKATVTAEFPTPAVRPSYSVLAKGAWTAAGFSILRPWPDALQEYLTIRNETTN